MAEWIKADPPISTSGRIYAVPYLTQVGLSAHTVIPPSGVILQLVADENVAYHAGNSRYKGLEIISSVGSPSLNSVFLGCELLVEGTYDYAEYVQKITTNCYTQEQYIALGYLLVHWSRKFPVITKDRIVAHSQVAGDEVRGLGQGKRDPGAGFDWKTLWFYYEQFLQKT